LLNQAVLPMTMLMSLALGRRYRAAEACGAALVLAGATVAAGLSSSMALQREALEGEAMRTGLLVFSLAQLAAAGAGLVKEGLLQHNPATRGVRTSGRGSEEESPEPIGNPIALGVALAWLRVPLGIALALALRHGETSLLAEFRDGWLCFCGAQPRPGDTGCPAAARNMILSVVYYAAQTLLGLRLTQRGSATLRSIAAVTAVPLSQFLFTSELLMTDGGTEAYSRGSALGLGLCLAGFALYLRGQPSAPRLPSKVLLEAAAAEGGGKSEFKGA